MWESIMLTLIATAGNNIGKVLQKKGTVILPPLSFKLKVIRAYAFNKQWLIGFVMDIFGALLMLRALSQAPVSVIQPVSGCGLAILSVFSHFYLKEVMNALDWLGIALAGVGTIGNAVFYLRFSGFISILSIISLVLSASQTLALLPAILKNGHMRPIWLSGLGCQKWYLLMFCAFQPYSISGVGIGGEEQNVSAVSLFRLPWLVFSVAILFIILNAWLHIYNSQRRGQELMESEVVEEIIFGLESGILFGMASVISKMGFLFSEQGFSKVVVPVCISISICCSATGFVYQTRGLKHGRAIVVSTCAAVASILTGVLAGMLALGEDMPSAPLARLSLLLGWSFITAGVILLVCSTRLMGLLPRPIRHVLKSNLERHHNLRRSGSFRVKDTSPPSAVIHASTLHHLITSPAKEKA